MAEWITARANELANLSVFADCFGADLYPLALLIEPVRAEAGDVIMRQGEPADFFLIIARGSAVVQHTDPEGATAEIKVDAGRILGEIALLRHSTRIATVVAAEDLSGWTGDDDAFDQLIELPGVLAMLVRTARQRVAAFIEPIPFRLRDGTELLLRPVLPGDGVRAEKGPVEFSSETMYRRFMTAREPTPGIDAITCSRSTTSTTSSGWWSMPRRATSSPTSDTCVSSPGSRWPRSHSSSATSIRAGESDPS